MKTIEMTYDHGIDSNKDRAAMEIAKSHGATFMASGCMLVGNFQRDMEFEVNDAQAEAMASALRAAGFEVEVLDVEED